MTLAIALNALAAVFMALLLTKTMRLPFRFSSPSAASPAQPRAERELQLAGRPSRESQRRLRAEPRITGPADITGAADQAPGRA
jgi:hypothetical protein